MRSKNQLLKDFKLKKLKFSENIDKYEKEADILFNLILKYLLPLEPNEFRFSILKNQIVIESKFSSEKILLKLNFGEGISEENEAEYFFDVGQGLIDHGSGRAKKIINMISKKITDA